MYNGYLEISGGEISGNTAEKGAGIYWESRNKAYLTGGSIINNTTTEGNGGGVYVADYGKVYVGGDIRITDNGNGNLYLDDNCIYHACGQDGVPNQPLTSNARIGISASDVEELISADGSGFREGDFRQMYSDSNQYFIRSVYDAEDEDHVYKLYINSWGHKDARYPRVKTVSVRNQDMLQDAILDYDKQIITLKVFKDNQEALKSAKLGSLISYTCDKDIYTIYGADEARDLTKAQEYKIISDNGTYVMLITQVEWVCREHKDEDGDCICDVCNAFSGAAIGKYDAQTKAATVFVAETGTYTLVFADYEDDQLAHADIVECTLEEGIHVVPQKDTSFTLASGDKVMLWKDFECCAPICEAFMVK